jgi:hypothetical protein
VELPLCWYARILRSFLTFQGGGAQTGKPATIQGKWSRSFSPDLTLEIKDPRVSEPVLIHSVYDYVDDGR